jgi:hypothetical protein
MGIKFMAMAIDAKIANSGQKFVLVMLANHCNDHTRQCNPSQKLLAEECSMGLSTLKRHIASLEEAGYVETVNVFKDNVQKPNQYLLKFDTSPNRATPPSESGYPSSPNRATEPEVKTRIEPVDQTSKFFEEFWAAYPKKVAKKPTREQFFKIKPDDELFKQIMKGLIDYKACDKVKNGFILDPIRWVRDRRWEDDVSSFGKPVSAAERATNIALGRPADQRLLTPEEQAERAKRIALR